MFDWKWNLSDLRADKPVRVFSCFSCGGGSSMGYKKAGFQVIGNCEIDPRVNALYLANLHPKYNYCMDLREFNRLQDLPEELFNLDILDGSPPCSTFSIAGLREKAWGKEKSFREGQKKQTLDDLFFVFLDTVEKLKPKVVVAENVTGIIKGNAKGYVNLIIKRFKELGYAVQIFQLNAAYMDVPQARERVFFIANRMGYPKLKLNFHNEIIRFGKVRTAHGKSIEKSPKLLNLVKIAKQSGDTCLGNTTEKLGKREFFNYMLCYDRSVAYCLAARCTLFRAVDNSAFSDGDCINISTFPQDYNFINQDVRYVCGMSVPPNMTANIANEIWKQWLCKTM